MRKDFPLWGTLLALLIALPAMGQIPPTPGNLVAQVDPTATPGIKLTWQLPMTPMMGGFFFKINRSTDDSSHFEAIGVVAEKSFQDWRVAPGHTYFYTVNSIVFHDTS